MFDAKTIAGGAANGHSRAGGAGVAVYMKRPNETRKLIVVAGGGGGGAHVTTTTAERSTSSVSCDHGANNPSGYGGFAPCVRCDYCNWYVGYWAGSSATHNVTLYHYWGGSGGGGYTGAGAAGVVGGTNVTESVSFNCAAKHGQYEGRVINCLNGPAWYHIINHWRWRPNLVVSRHARSFWAGNNATIVSGGGTQSGNANGGNGSDYTYSHTETHIGGVARNTLIHGGQGGIGGCYNKSICLYTEPKNHNGAPYILVQQGP